MHDDKGERVGQRPFLIRPLLEEAHAALEEGSSGGNDFNSCVVDQTTVERDEVSTVLRMAVGIAEFSEHPFGGDQAELRIPRGLGGFRMAFLP